MSDSTDVKEYIEKENARRAPTDGDDGGDDGGDDREADSSADSWPHDPLSGWTGGV